MLDAVQSLSRSNGGVVVLSKELQLCRVVLSQRNRDTDQPAVQVTSRSMGMIPTIQAIATHRERACK